jgi:hypothetical protein
MSVERRKNFEKVVGVEKLHLSEFLYHYAYNKEEYYPSFRKGFKNKSTGIGMSSYPWSIKLQQPTGKTVLEHPGRKTDKQRSNESFGCTTSSHS